jgi:hypothetical protein
LGIDHPARDGEERWRVVEMKRAELERAWKLMSQILYSSLVAKRLTENAAGRRYAFGVMFK